MQFWKRSVSLNAGRKISMLSEPISGHYYLTSVRISSNITPLNSLSVMFAWQGRYIEILEAYLQEIPHLKRRLLAYQLVAFKVFQFKMNT